MSDRNISGEVAEWTKAVDSKSTVGSAHRGFESHPLRPCFFCFLWMLDVLER
jgi:hypothetical protein